MTLAQLGLFEQLIGTFVIASSPLRLPLTVCLLTRFLIHSLTLLLLPVQSPVATIATYCFVQCNIGYYTAELCL